MPRIRRCLEPRCQEPVVGRAYRCPKHQAEKAARETENLLRYQLAAEMLHDRRLLDGDTARVAEVAGEFETLVKVWGACLALRRPIDALPMKTMEPLGIAQNQLVDHCVWRAMRLRAYVLDGVVPVGSDETARISEDVTTLSGLVQQATLEERRRRGWPV